LFCKLLEISYEEVFNTFTRWLIKKELKQGSILLKQKILEDFILFLESNKVQNISDINIGIISRYLETKRSFKASTKNSIIITLRAFLRTPEVACALKYDFSVNLRMPNDGRHESLPSTYTNDEIRNILSCIDRSSNEGKKEYAVILLAIDTGLRTSDIINLKVDDINWDTGTIWIVQKKTGKHICVAISDGLKWALLDYLKHARPKNSQYKNLFIRSIAPFAPYISAGHFYKRLNKYFVAAGVNMEGKHHGLHAMRHNLATRLLKDNVPITAIADALGHSYANVTKQYIRIDTEKLRLAALEVPSNG
jgi:integrase